MLPKDLENHKTSGRLFLASGNAMEAYYATHEWIRLDPEALNDFQVIFRISLSKTKENSTVKIVPLKLKAIAD